MKKIFIILSLLFSFLLSACNKTDPNDPSQAAENFYKAIAAGDIKSAMAKVQQVDTQSKPPVSLEDRLTMFHEEMKKEGKVSFKAEAGSIHYNPDKTRASVRVEMNFESGEKTSRTLLLSMIKVDGEWKVEGRE